MKLLPLKAVAAALLVSTAGALTASSAFAQTYVNGYTRSNGTYVQGHYRSSPNYTRRDNYSYYGNVNPYTGKRGTGARPLPPLKKGAFAVVHRSSWALPVLSRLNHVPRRHPLRVEAQLLANEITFTG